MDTYKEIKTYTYPNAIVRVHIPDISEEERAKRMRHLVNVAERFMQKVQEYE